LVQLVIGVGLIVAAVYNAEAGVEEDSPAIANEGGDDWKISGILYLGTTLAQFLFTPAYLSLFKRAKRGCGGNCACCNSKRKKK